MSWDETVDTLLFNVLPYAVLAGVLIVAWTLIRTIGPPSALIQMLGVAWAARRAGLSPTVFVARNPPLLDVSVGGVRFLLHPRPDEAFCRYETDGMTVGQYRAIAAAGPLACLLQVLGCAVVAYLAFGDSLLLFAIALAFAAV